MKRVTFIFVLFSICLFVKAECIKFSISDGIDSLELKAKMESSITTILNEVNAAYAENRALDFSKMEVNERVRQSMAMLWENTPFICTDEEIVEHCIMTGAGYQVRNIPLLMKSIEARDSTQEYQEAVISFDRQGNVESFYLSISMNLYMNVIPNNIDLTDLHRRQVILDFVEQFRTAFIQKDMKFIEQIFSDQSLYNMGKSITTNQDSVTTQIRSNIKRTKEEFIMHLRGVLLRVDAIKVDIDDIEVIRHLMNHNFYGVTLKIGWNANLYYDEGYLFQLWDFTDEDNPQIHVTIWQPDMINGKPLSKDDIFSLYDFDI